MKNFVCFLFIGLFFVSMVHADIPTLPLYPEILKKTNWDNQKTFALKVKAKIKNLHGMGSVMKKAEDDRKPLKPNDYMLTTEEFKKMGKTQIETFYQTKALNNWNTNIKKLLESLKQVELKADEYLQLIGNDAFFNDSRKYLTDIKKGAIEYMNKVQGFDESKLVTEWIKSTLQQWRIVTGQIHIDIVVKNMNDIEKLATSVKTIEAWISNKIQSQSIRAVGTATPQLKNILPQDIIGKWKTCSSDPWQPKQDSAIPAKFKELLELIKKTREVLGPMDEK